MRRSRRAWAGVAIALSLCAVDALGRVGGGEGYSGGRSGGGGYSGGGWSGGGYSSGYSGSGSSADLSFIFDLIRLWIYLHRSALPVALFIDLVIIIVIRRMLSGGRSATYLSKLDVDGPFGLHTRSVNVRQRLEGLRQADPNFSEVLFRDFCAILYTQLHRARGERRLDDYADYFSAEAIAVFKGLSQNLTKAHAIVIGAMSIKEVTLGDAETRIVLGVDSNYTEDHPAGTPPQTWYAQETWVLTRKKGVLSREPENIRVIGCPACGAPAAKASNGSCSSCRRVIRSGEFDWYLKDVRCEREQRPPVLTTEVPEEGTNLPTLYDPELQAMIRAYKAQYPDFDPQKLSERIGRTFMTLQQAWTERKWEKIRAFESDNMFQSHCYWIAEYRRQKLINVLDKIQLKGVVPVKLRVDKYFASFTVRVFCSMVDYVKREDGGFARGGPSSKREFTEYWTFIRGRSAQPPKGDGETTCPQCGAPLKINMAGHCEYCQSKISSGNFDWVLSEIEQDESYFG